MAGGNAVAGLERRGPVDALAVEQRAVLAAQVLHLPLAFAGIAHQRQVLAGKPGVVGVTQFVGAGPSQRDAVAIQRNGNGLPVKIADDEFFSTNLKRPRHPDSVSRRFWTRFYFATRGARCAAQPERREFAARLEKMFLPIPGIHSERTSCIFEYTFALPRRPFARSSTASLARMPEIVRQITIDVQ